MGQFKRGITVSCSIEKAFDYVSDWQTLKSFWSNILDITPISCVQLGPGAAFETVFKLGRAEIPTTLEVVEFVRDQRLVMKSTRGLKIQSTWEFRETSDGTSILFTLSYEMPPGFVRSEQDRAAIEKEFDSTAGQSMELLKWILESSTMRALQDWG